MSPLSDKVSLLLGILLFGQVCLAYAEKADRDKPLNIEADIMSLDNANHVSIFDGKVELTQGTLRVIAEKIVVTQDATGHKFCVATGHLASFRQKRDGANEYVEGYGERIEYNTLSEKIDLYVKARVKREQDDVRGDHITYSTQTEIFRVNSPENTGRVHATLQPQNKDSKNTETKAAEIKAPAASQSQTKTIEPVIPPKSSEPASAEPVTISPKVTEPKTVTPITIEPVSSEPAPAGK
jgi:lipopolysaccharide export system protein LptA